MAPQGNWIPIAPQQDIGQWKPLQPKYPDEPSTVGNWIDKFNEWDQPIFGDLSPYAKQVGGAYEKGAPSWLSNTILDTLPGSSLLREYYKKPEDRSMWSLIKSQIPGLNTYLDIGGMNDPKAANPNEIVGDALIGKAGGFVANEMTRPSNLADLAMTGGAWSAARRGLMPAAKWLTRGSRAIAAPSLAGGVRESYNALADEGPWTEERSKRLGGGLAQSIFGGLGVFQPTPHGPLQAADEVIPPISKSPYPDMEPGGLGPSGQFEFPFMEDPRLNQRIPEKQPVLEDISVDYQQPSLPFGQGRGLYGRSGEVLLPPADRSFPPDATGQFSLLPQLEQGESFEGVMRGRPFEPPEPPRIDPPGGGGTVSPSSTDGADVVSITKFEAGELELLRQQGYVPWEGHRDARGRPQWIRPNKEPSGEVIPSTEPTSSGGGNRLPRDLQGGRPRYQEYELEFDNDLDKALYIVAQQTPSRRDADYMRFVLDQLELDEAGARELGAEIRKNIGEQVRGQPAGVVKLQAILDTETPNLTPVGNEPFPVPTEKVTKSFIERMKAEGIRYLGKDEQGRSLFQRIAEDAGGEWEVGRARQELGGMFKRLFSPEGGGGNVIRDPRLTGGQLEAGGTTDFDFRPQMGQQELPFGPQGIRQQTRLGAIAEEPGMRLGLEEQGNLFPEEPIVMPPRARPQAMPRIRGAEVGPEDWEPQAAQLPSGKAVFTTDVRNNISELTKGYSKPLPHVMVREGIQNFLDAIEGMGDLARGKLKVVSQSSYNNRPASIEIIDNGKGMTRDELFGLFTTMHRSGKVGQAGATGGKGVGKATYVFGGDHFEMETVARAADGMKYKSSFSGKPETFLPQGFDAQGNPIGGFDIITEKVPQNTPTGTRIKTILKADQEAFNAHQSAENIVKYSRNKEGKFEYETPWEPKKEVELKGNPNDTLMAKDVDIDGKNNKADFYVPEDAKLDTRSYITVQYLNNGMWQFEKVFHIGAETHGIPDTIVVDLKPKVPELSDNYPFPVQRESVLDKVQTDIENAIKDNIISPMGNKKKRDLAKLWNQMQATPPVPGETVRESVFFDSGGRLTPQEADFVSNHPIIQDMQRQFDDMFNELFTRWGRQEASDRVIRTGIFMGDPGTYGWHIPDPLDPTNRSMIIINPFEHILKHNNPANAAWEMVGTAKHEIAHAGTHDPPRIELNFDPADLADPRLGKDFQQYLNEVNIQGGLNYGHGMPFIRRLGEVYATTGARTAFYHADLIKSILTGGSKSGKYSPEVQELLRIYSESRGRAATQEDILSGTGIKQADTGPGGTGNIPGDGQAIGEGTLAERIDEPLASRAPNPTLEELKARVRSSGTPKGTATKEPSIGRQAYDFSRGVTTTGDLSAPLRQGLPLVFTKSWWTSWDQMLKSFGSEQAFNKTLSDLRGRRIFQREIDVNTGKARPSFAEKAGLELMDLNRKLGRNEEAVVSSWVETGEFLGKDNKFQKAYQKYPGRYARASNRAYTAFLNQLRADTFESLIKDASKAFDADVKAGTIGKTGAKNPMTDLTFAKEIADFVNTATGRGPLKVQAPAFELNKIGGTNVRVPIAEYNLERIAPFLTATMFSPRLIASRVRMLNPATYMMASPFVRKQYLKAFASTAAAWTATAVVAKGAGAEVSLDPTSADFGKMRFGNTRMDPGAGFQQYLVAWTRLTSGKYTSSSTGQTTELGQGYRAETKGDVAHRFVANKLHPILKFAHDIAFASERTPFQVGDRTMQLFVPLIAQDLYELAREDPSLLPLMGPIGAGMGSQTYDKGEAISKFIPRERDVTLVGNESIYPWMWGGQ